MEEQGKPCKGCKNLTPEDWLFGGYCLHCEKRLGDAQEEKKEYLRKRGELDE